MKKNTSATHLTPQQLADRLGIHLETIRSWYRQGIGPKGFQAKPRGRIFYPIAEVERWEGENLGRRA